MFIELTIIDIVYRNTNPDIIKVDCSIPTRIILTELQYMTDPDNGDTFFVAQIF